MRFDWTMNRAAATAAERIRRRQSAVSNARCTRRTMSNDGMRARPANRRHVARICPRTVVAAPHRHALFSVERFCPRFGEGVPRGRTDLDVRFPPSAVRSFEATVVDDRAIVGFDRSETRLDRGKDRRVGKYVKTIRLYAFGDPLPDRIGV